MNLIIAGQIILMLLGLTVKQKDFEIDIFKTSEGELTITFIGHGTLMMQFGGKTIHIDPVGTYADYAKLPKADLILITHNHGDHLDIKAVGLLQKSSTETVLTKICQEQYPGGKIMGNGETGVFAGIKVEAVPAYNIKHMRNENSPYHPKGDGNGYVLHFGDTKVYVAGDTENIPEMKELKDIDIAFLPMNLPYTMTPEMVFDAVKMFNPKILYPYHYGNTDTRLLLNLMKGLSQTEVRIRRLN
jgi:L-ascorbate metabolism protein UlaG (beta-lactamase superfamily)